MYIKASISALILALPMDTIAQTTPDKNQTEHIVVTGTRTAKLLSNSPVLVDVIDGETIAKISQGTLAQALNYIPGIVIKRSVKDGYNIQMQGFDGDHVLVLIDGQPIVSPTGSSADLDQIPASNIAQIEIIRGAASVMYGSAAMGGVINIITHKSDQPSLQLDYDVSQYQGNNIEDGDLNHTIKVNAVENFVGWRTQLNALIIDDQGYDYDSNTVSQDAASVDKKFITLRANKAHKNLATSIKYQWLSDEKLRDSSIIPGQSEVIFYQTNVDQQQIDLGLKSTKHPKTPWQINARYINHQETSGQSNSLRDTTITLSEINGQKVFQLGNIELVTGAAIHADQLDQDKPAVNVIEVDNESRGSVEVFVQGNWVKPDYQLLAGMRSQHDSDFGWHDALRLSSMKNFSLGKGKLQWRAGIGQSYRVPNLKERFYIFDHSALGYMVLGNKALEPETADSLNSSLTFNSTLADNVVDLRSDISVHFSKTDNLIDSVIDVEKSQKTGLSIYQYQNISEATIHGFNISTQLTFSQWKTQLNYSYLTSEDENNQRLFSRPRHQIKFNINYDIDAYDIEVIAYAVYQAGEAVPDSYQGVENNEYTTFNTVFNQAITNNLSWRISVDNIFDEHKKPTASSQNLFDARPVSSRTISAGISYQF
ncbi:TonB-dependent siderophore receptor [Colwellia sp. MB02u-9]|uniref:TonB-dependent receptor plug domain-containing protein n=1 Tax=Colwellia sp. MB02u-9 TaxID=2759823 RepID=UPI0015F3A9A0|nr:TonB-dependent receptor [Colwellia sp. MB02u-9]MBA6295260.1 TonB-dependent receptor [Colwellia sp. MB02u-9]